MRLPGSSLKEFWHQRMRTKARGFREAQQDLVVQQRLHGGMPERSLGLEVLSPDPDLRFQPLRLVGSPQSLLKPVSRG